MEITQKTKIRTATKSSNSTPGYISEKNPKTLIRKDTCSLMFIAALLTIAKIWKQPKCPSADERIKRTEMGTSLVV